MMPVSATLRTTADLSLRPRSMRARWDGASVKGRWSNMVSRRRSPIGLSIHRHAVPEGHPALPSIKAPKATARTDGCVAFKEICSKNLSSAGVRKAYRSVEAWGPVVCAHIKLASSAATSLRLNRSSMIERSSPHRRQVACRTRSSAAVRAMTIGLVTGNDLFAHRAAAWRTGAAQSLSRHTTAANRNGLGKLPVILSNAASRSRPSR